MSVTPSRPANNFVTVAVMLTAVAVLYVGREIFVPFALAILLSFLLAPPVSWLRRIRMPACPDICRRYPLAAAW